MKDNKQNTLREAIQTIVEQNTQKDFLYRTTDFFRNHPTIFGTVLYVQIMIIGVIYMWSLFREFGLNIMDFAEISDFLLFAFKQPNTFIFSLVIIVLGILQFIIVSKEGYFKIKQYLIRLKSFPTGLRVLYAPVSIFPFIAIILWIICIFLTPFIWGYGDARIIKTGNSLKVVIQLKSSDVFETSSKLENETFLIGTAGKFAFFYDYNKKRTHIIPITNILKIHTVPVDST